MSRNGVVVFAEKLLCIERKKTPRDGNKIIEKCQYLEDQDEVSADSDGALTPLVVRKKNLKFLWEHHAKTQPL